MSLLHPIRAIPPPFFGWEVYALCLRPDLGVGICHGMVIDKDGFIYIGVYRQTLFYRFNPTTKVWEALASAPHTFYRGYQMAYDPVRHKIYKLAGQALTGFAEYDIATNAWTALTPVPLSTDYGAICIHGGDAYPDYIFVSRGDDGVEFYRYEIVPNAWAPLASVPFTPYTMSTGDRVGSKIYYYRGGYYPEFYVYDIATNTWSALSPPPKGYTILLSDGTDLLSFATSNDIYLYKVAEDKWYKCKPRHPEYIAYYSHRGRMFNDYVYFLSYHAGVIWRIKRDQIVTV